MISFRIYIALLALMTLLLGHANWRLHVPDASTHGPDTIGADVILQLDGLSRGLDDGAAEQMQSFFPEGYVFTWALYGLSWVQVGMRSSIDEELRERAEHEVRRAIKAIDSPEGRAPFPRALDPAHGVFFNGWLTWLQGGLLTIAREPSVAEAEAFRRQCAQLAAAFERSGSPFLESYHKRSWPGDTIVAVAALRLHDHLFEPRYEELIQSWLSKVEQRLDPSTGLIAHESDPVTGAPFVLARGSSQALGLRFLIDIDPQLARQHYEIFREKYVHTHAGMIPGVREYPKGSTGASDVDSGPILLGFTGPATVVGLGAALSFGDNELAIPLLAGVEMVGMPTGCSEKRYGAGLLPVGEAFLVWSKTARPWISEVQSGDFAPIVGPYWRWRWHLVSAAMMLLLWGGGFFWWARRRRTDKEFVVEDEEEKGSSGLSTS